MSRRHIGLCLALGAALLLAGCGKQGVLEQPPPLFGSKAKARYEESRQQAEAAAAARAAQAPVGSAEKAAAEQDNAPLTKRDIQDPAQKLTPLSRAPIPGAPNPFGAPVSTTPGN
ncbi:MAG: hypothetical protein ABIO39_10700 [Caulobacteraceae bacterium]